MIPSEPPSDALPPKAVANRFHRSPAAAEDVRQGLRETLGLSLLFGMMYFIQGIGEPTEGLIAQPIRSLLKSWGHSAADIATFGMLLSLPWSLKPLYGLLTDFVPILGSRRRSYLIITTLATVLGLGYLYFAPPEKGASGLLLYVLLVPTVGVAFSDVVVDALMVEKGQPLGLTGRLQSVQWAAMYSAMILTGFVGGYLSENDLQHFGFLICAVATAGSLILTILFVRERKEERGGVGERETGSGGDWERGRLGDKENLSCSESPNLPISQSPCLLVSLPPRSPAVLRSAFRNPAVLAVGGFLFLWNFNPFAAAVLYVHMTVDMGFSEQFYGNLNSLLAVAAVAASVAYGFYCRSIRFDRLIHVAIVTGILSTAAYSLVEGQKSAVAVTLAVGFTYMTATLIQLDLAARVCPRAAAGTMFALLMALSNLAVSLSAGLGGYLYELWSDRWGSQTAFNCLVTLGALMTAGCWLIVPFLRDRQPSQPARQPSQPARRAGWAGPLDSADQRQTTNCWVAGVAAESAEHTLKPPNQTG